MLRDLNFCPSEPPELLELHEFQSLPPCGPPFPSRNKKGTPGKRKRWNQQITVNWISEHHLPHFFLRVPCFSLKVNWGPGGVESWNPLQMIPRIPNPWVSFPLRIPKPPFAQTNKSTNLVDFQLIKNPWFFPSGFRMISKKLRTWPSQGFNVLTLPVFLHFLGSMASRAELRSAEASRRLAPWICSGALERFGWMDGGRRWEVLAGFGGGGFFSPRRMKTSIFLKNKSEDVERDLGTFCWLYMLFSYICSRRMSGVQGGLGEHKRVPWAAKAHTRCQSCMCRCR